MSELKAERSTEKAEFEAKNLANSEKIRNLESKLNNASSELESKFVELKERTAEELKEKSQLIEELMNKIDELEEFLPDTRKKNGLLKSITTSIDSILKSQFRDDIMEKAISVQSFFELMGPDAGPNKRASNLEDMFNGLSSNELPKGIKFGKFKSGIQGKISDQTKQVELLEKIHNAYNESIVTMKAQLEAGKHEMIEMNQKNNHSKHRQSVHPGKHHPRSSDHPPGRDSIWGNTRRPNRESVHPGNPRTTVCIAGLASKKHNVDEKPQFHRNRQTKLGKTLSLRLAMNDTRMKQTDQMLCELSGINLPKGVSFSNFTTDVQKKFTDQSNKLNLLEKLYSTYFTSFNELKKQLQISRMELIHINNPDGHRVAPVEKSTSIELNESYSLKQVLRQRSECLEIIFEFRKNIAKNHDYAKSCENKISHMDEMVESRFAKQRLQDNAKVFKTEESHRSELADLSNDISSYKKAFDIVAMECYNKDEKYENCLEKIKGDFNQEQNKVKSLEKFNKHLAGKLGNVSGQKGRFAKKYEQSKFENFELRNNLLDLIDENNRLKMNFNGGGENITRKIPIKSKIPIESIPTKIPISTKLSEFLKPVVSKSKSLQNLVMASPREINPRVKTKNKNSSSKTELKTFTAKTSQKTSIKTSSNTSSKTSPKTFTSTSSTKTSLTVLMPKLTNDQILPSKMLKNSLQDRYQNHPKLTLFRRNSDYSANYSDPIKPSISKYISTETSTNKLNKYFKLPKLPSENTHRENLLAKPAAPKILEIDVNRNILESLKNMKI